MLKILRKKGFHINWNPRTHAFSNIFAEYDLQGTIQGGPKVTEYLNLLRILQYTECTESWNF